MYPLGQDATCPRFGAALVTQLFHNHHEACIVLTEATLNYSTLTERVPIRYFRSFRSAIPPA